MKRDARLIARWPGDRFARLTGSLIAVALLAAGCSLEPVYRRPEAPVTAIYPTGDAYQSPSSGDGGIARAAVDIGWRDFFTDARLRRLVELALSNNRDLRIATLTVARAQAQHRIERAALFPQIGAVSESSTVRTPASTSSTGHAIVAHDYLVGLSAAWEIDFFGRLQSLSGAALQQYYATAQARKAAEILLVSEVADQYLALLSFDELADVTKHTLESAQASYQLTALQLRTGTGTELAVSEAETVVEQAKANYAAQVRGRAQAENALVALIGQPLPTDLPPPVPLSTQRFLARIPEGLPSDLLTHRPDIMQAEAILRAANANIGAARAAFFPSISLTGNLGTVSSALSGLFATGSQAWSFAPSITAPIFEAGSLRANLDVARLQKDIDVAQYEKTIQTAFREVADGLAARGTFDEQVASLERYTAAEQRRLDLSQMRFRNGVDPYLSVLTAQTDLYSAQQALVTARLARLSNLVDLYRYLGGGWIEHTGDASPSPEDVRTTASVS